jgi:hypothetical protein
MKSFTDKIPRTNDKLKLELLKKILPFDLADSYVDFYNQGMLEYKILNILLNELQNKKDFEKKMMVLEESFDMLRAVFDEEPEKIMILFKELLEPIL